MKIYRANIRLNFPGMVLGGLPSNPLLLEFVNKERGNVEATPLAPEDLPMVESGMAPKIEAPVHVFRRTDGDRCCIDEHVIRGIIREALRKNGLSRKLRGLWTSLYTDPRVIPFSYTQPIIQEYRMFQAMTAMGPRSVILRHEALIGASLDFILELHDSGEKDGGFSMETVKDMLVYGGRYVGLGAGRGKSGLKYVYGLYELNVWKPLPVAE